MPEIEPLNSWRGSVRNSVLCVWGVCWPVGLLWPEGLAVHCDSGKEAENILATLHSQTIKTDTHLHQHQHTRPRPENDSVNITVYCSALGHINNNINTEPINLS